MPSRDGWAIYSRAVSARKARLQFGRIGERVAWRHLGKANQNQLLLRAICRIDRVEIVAQAAAGIWQAHQHQQFAGCELHRKAEAVEDLAVFERRLAENAVVAARVAKASRTVLNLRGQLDECRTVGLRIDAQGVDRLRLLVRLGRRAPQSPLTSSGNEA